MSESKNDDIEENVIDTLTRNLEVQLNVYNNAGVLLSSMRSNPYITGYIQGKLVGYLAYSVAKLGLKPENANQVSGMVLIEVFEEDAREVSNIIKSHSSTASPEYMDGKRKGELLIAYAVGKEDVSSDPQYDEAVKAFANDAGTQELRKLPDERAAAIAGLEGIWFHSLMRQYQ